MRMPSLVSVPGLNILFAWNSLLTASPPSHTLFLLNLYYPSRLRSNFTDSGKPSPTISARIAISSFLLNNFCSCHWLSSSDRLGTGPGMGGHRCSGSQVKTRWPEGMPGRLTSRMLPPLHSLLKHAEAVDFISLLTASVETTDPHLQFFN